MCGEVGGDDGRQVLVYAAVFDGARDLLVEEASVWARVQGEVGRYDVRGQLLSERAAGLLRVGVGHLRSSSTMERAAGAGE